MNNFVPEFQPRHWVNTGRDNVGLWDLILFRSLDWGSIVPVSACWFIPLRNITQSKYPRRISFAFSSASSSGPASAHQMLANKSSVTLPESNCFPPHPCCQQNFLTGKLCLHLTISPLKSFFPYSQLWSSGFLLFDLVLGFYICIQYARGFSEFCIVCLTESGAHWTRQADQQVQGSSCLCLPSTRIVDRHHCIQLFMWVQRTTPGPHCCLVSTEPSPSLVVVVCALASWSCHCCLCIVLLKT